MLTVACVLRSGGIYDAGWVARLRAGVARNLKEPHRFVCLSDVDVPCERVPLEHNWPGWWAKIEALRLPGPVLFFDLDTAIVGDLADMAAEAKRSSFVMLQDFYRSTGLGSGVMAWVGSGDHLFQKFLKNPEQWMLACKSGGDQEFLERVNGLDNAFRWQSLLPGQVVSYKIHCRDGIPADARVVCLHGKPKFADMPASDPVRQAWELAA